MTTIPEPTSEPLTAGVRVSTPLVRAARLALAIDGSRKTLREFVDESLIQALTQWETENAMRLPGDWPRSHPSRSLQPCRQKKAQAG